MTHYTYNWSRSHFSGQKEYATQKIAKVKAPEKGKEKGKKNIWNG